MSETTSLRTQPLLHCDFCVASKGTLIDKFWWSDRVALSQDFHAIAY